MKILLCFASFVCAVAMAKPTDETQKLSSTLLPKPAETSINNNRVESSKDQIISPRVPISSESGEKDQKPVESNGDDLNTAADDDKPKISYVSAINHQANPSTYSSQLNSIHNTNPSFPARSVAPNYRLIASTYPSASYGSGSGSYEAGSGPYVLGSGSYGLGSGTYGLGPKPYVLNSGSYGLGSEPYEIGPKPYVLSSGSYGLGSEQYGIGPKPYVLSSGSYGLGSEPYGIGPKPYVLSSGSYGLGSESYGLGSGSYGVGPGSYGVGSGSYVVGSGSYGVGPGSYRLGSKMYELESGSYGVGPGSYGSSESQALGISSYPQSLYGLGSGSYGLSGSSESFSSSLPVDIPTPYSSATPCRDGINVAQQIIHKPIITEVQEVIHKPIITEMQEIVNKPVISEVQQVIHKPLYTEHIDLGPSYHGYQKHIVKQPIYHKPTTTSFVHQPVAHTGTIHLADEYENVANVPITTQNVCPTGIGSSYGLNDVPFQAAYGSEIGGMHQNAQYGPAYSVPNTVSYGSGWPSSISTPIPVGQSSSTHAIPASVNYSSMPSYRYILGPSKQQIARFNTGDEESHRNIDETSQPKAAAEQIAYDELKSYKQQPNDNQQLNDNQSPQQGKNSEDHKQIKMDVDAITKQLEKNPEMKKQLMKIITESIGDQMTQTDKKQQDKTIQ